jgi:hypothetical protein
MTLEADSTATLPAGWETRLVAVRNDNTGGAIGWCLEVHDLACSKLVAGRTRDWDFVQVLLEADMVDHAILEERLTKLDVSPDRVESLRQRLRRLREG